MARQHFTFYILNSQSQPRVKPSLLSTRLCTRNALIREQKCGKKATKEEKDKHATVPRRSEILSQSPTVSPENAQVMH